MQALKFGDKQTFWRSMPRTCTYPLKILRLQRKSTCMTCMCTLSGESVSCHFIRVVIEEEKYGIRKNLPKEDFGHHIFHLHPPLLLQNLLPFTITAGNVVCLNYRFSPVLFNWTSSMYSTIHSSTVFIGHFQTTCRYTVESRHPWEIRKCPD